MATEEEIYEQFIIEEDARLLAEIQEQKQAQDKQAEDYERALRDRMKKKAEEDRRQRAIDAENRRIEAERMQREYEAQKAAEADQQRIREAEEKRRKEEARSRAAALEQKRIEEARKNREEWESSEKAAKDAAYLSSLPQWKRDLVMKQRREANSDTTVFPGAASR